MQAIFASQELQEKMADVLKHHAELVMKENSAWTRNHFSSTFVNLYGLSAARREVSVIELILGDKPEFTANHVNDIEASFDKALDAFEDVYYYRTYQGAMVFNKEGVLMGLINLMYRYQRQAFRSLLTDGPKSATDLDEPARLNDIVLEMLVTDFNDFPARFAEELENNPDLS